MFSQSSLSISQILQTLLLSIFVLAFAACTVNEDAPEEIATLAIRPTSTPSTIPTTTKMLPTATWTVIAFTPIPTITPMPLASEIPILDSESSSISDGILVSDIRPPTGLVNDMAVVSDNDIWAVGVYGYIAHWDGSGWITMTTPITATLNGVDFTSATDGWAVGDGGVILHWDGNAWDISRPYTPQEPEGSLAFSYLDDVDFISPTDGWAVGSWSYEGGGSGFILHWDGQSWQEDNSNPDDMYACSCYLNAVTMLAPDDAWAVGGDAQNLITRSSGIFHWDGQKWELARTSPESNHLSTVSGSAATNVWAAGIKDPSALDNFSTVLRWDGQEWAEVSLPYPAKIGWLNSILMLSEDDGWLVGGVNRVFHWDGSEWLVIKNEVTDSIAEVAITPSGKIVGITGAGMLLQLTSESVKPWSDNE